MSDWEIQGGDVLERLREMPSESVHCVVTSPPYFGLRDYSTGKWEGGDAECDHRKNPAPFSDKAMAKSTIGAHAATGHALEPYKDVCGKCGAVRVDKQIGLEATPEAFIARMVEVFAEVRRVLRHDGTCWVNMGDSYVSSPPGNKTVGVSAKSTLHGVDSERYRQTLANSVQQKRDSRGNGLKPKDLMMMPARVALALQADGWWLRSEITWCKRAPMPESVTDRPTSATEKIYLLTKSARYFYDAEAVREPHSRDYSNDRYPVGGRKHRVDADNPLARNGSGQYDRDYDDPKYQWNPAETGRNLWNYWLLSPEPYAAAHFATFPTEIPRRAILAGTSERGACAECGAPWRRVVEKEKVGFVEYQNRHKVGASGQDRDDGGLIMSKGHTGRYETSTTTTGWQPTCRHDAPTVPCTVLDPFSGAGTTVMVALRLGRRGVGIELNPEYVAMSRERIIGDAPMFNTPLEQSA